MRIHFHKDQPRGKTLPASVGPFEVVATCPKGTLVIDRGRFAETISGRRIIPAN